MISFSIWFYTSWYGGLTCCIFAITTNVLYSTLHRRGRSRQLARVTVVCVISALLLFPAIIWFNSRFNAQQAVPSVYEVVGILVYVAICGWIVPLAITSLYCLLAFPRSSTPTALNLGSMPQPITTYQAPRYQPGVEVPFVYSKETAWGWLEYYSGSFQGQRLALKRTIVTIGRDEQCDIWLDDDMASRHHAELAWNNGQISLTDCESLNGILLNKRPVRGTVLLASHDILQIGSHHFVFVMAEQQEILTAQDDPLSRHTWRSTQDLQTAVNQPVLLIRNSMESIQSILSPSAQEEMTSDLSFSHRDPIALIDPATPLPQLSHLSTVLRVLDGELVGHRFILELPVMTIGRGSECDIVINDASISRQHAQILHQADGIYLQDLTSRNGTRVNDEPLLSSHLLKSGDIISIGKVNLDYTAVQPTDPTSSSGCLAAPIVSPPLLRTLAGPTPLKLPSKRKN
jgi:pSer/pThr/pTyr-binding forkhead associated (FHA) protein